MRDTYIENKDLDKALGEYLEYVCPMPSEKISATDSVGRITSEAIYANVCDPVYNASAMDGIAVNSETTLSASELTPLTLNEGEYEYVNTGGAINPPFDSVIMIEDVIKNGESISIVSPSRPWQHIRCIGETVVATEMVIPSGRKIRAIDLGAILASGNPEVRVFKKPRVMIIPTGNEMVEKVEDLKKGALMESNSRVFAAMVEEFGGIPFRHEIVKDDEVLLEDALKEAAENYDAVIINAGSSAGTKDFTSRIIAKLGNVITHGLAIKPGKPTILGTINNKQVIGVPGYPVSAYIVMEKVVREVISKMTGINAPSRMTAEAVLTKRVVSSFKNEEYIRVAMGFVNGKLMATPLSRGAAQTMSMVKADGIVTLDRYTEGIEAGETVQVELYRSLDEIKKNLVIVGSHDVVIDVISDKMPVSSAHVGSMGGILALKSGSCHVAPIHLLDEETGIYNVKYVREFFTEKMALIKGLGRTQGIAVPKGNPKNIDSVKQLKGGKVSFANRQNGAGTRILFDFLLKKADISPEEVVGYDKEYTTHLAVASAVKNGAADCGMLVSSAASILDLDFIKVGEESYDFLVKADMLVDDRIKKFIEVLKSSDFKKQVEKIGGYTFNGIGEVTIIND
ncbi:MAG: molybdopterin biosynthesis protein [Clostridia bacterium]|nr:molybdopterin biosynthesis protein [Clostridia bacterium]